MLKSGYRARLFRCLALAAVASSVPLVQADQYSLGGVVNPDFNDISAWYNVTTGLPATTLPGLLDYVGMESFNNFGTTIVNLRDDRTNSSGRIYGLEFALNSNTYGITNGLELYQGTISFGRLNVGYLQVNGYGSAVTSTLNGLIANGQSLNVNDGATLEIVNSTLGFESLGTYSPTATGTISLLGTTSTGKYGNFAGDLSVDNTSSLKFEGDGVPYVYASSLTYNSGIFNLAGSLETVGAKIAQSNFTDTPTATINVTGSSANWVDLSDSIVSLGFGGTGNLNIDGGTVNIKTGLRVGEGNYYTDFTTGNFIGVNGTGHVTVSNGGTLETSSLGLSGQYRNLTSTFQPIASSSGSLTVTSNGLVKVQSIDAYDSTGLGPTSATIDVNTGGTLEVNSLLGGALNLNTGATASNFALNVSNGGHFKAGFAQFIGGIGGNVVADFSGASTTVEITNLYSTVGAYVTLDGVQATLGNVFVGWDSKPGGNLEIQNTQLTIDGGPNVGTSPLVNAYSGTMTVKNSTVIVAPDKVPSISVGSFNGGTTSGTLNWESTDYSAPGTFTAATNGTLNIKSSSIVLDDFFNPNTGILSRTAVNVGVTPGASSANITDSLVSTWQFRTGTDAAGVADLVVKNSTIEARADQFTNTSPGSILIGTEGKSTVEIFKSTLNGPQIYIGPNGLLKGDGTLQGLPLSATPTTNVINNGKISPGHSPGHLSIIGSLVNNGTLEMEVDLANPSSFDFITATGSITLGGKLKLVALGSGAFDPSKSYTFFGGSSILGSFSSFEIDPAFGITASAFSINSGGYFGINPTTTPVPEPATMITLGVGVAVILRRRRKS